MLIKPLEKKLGQTALFKISFLVTLVVTGVLLNKVFLKQKAEIPSILGKSQEIKFPNQNEIIKQAQDNNLVQDSFKKAENFGGEILGVATDNFNKIASDAGSFVSQTIYENTIGKIVSQIGKLPNDQQEKIRAEICK